MSLIFHCGCGEMLRVPDSAAGELVRCPSCRTIAPARGARRSADEAAPAVRPRQERADSPRRRSKPARKSGTDPVRMILLLAVGGFVLVGCLAAGGVGIYLYSSGGGSLVGPSAREQLIGQWETDPDTTRMLAAGNPLGIGMHIDLGLTFNADQTFHQRHILNLTGRWSIESGLGQSARVRMVVRFGEFDSDPIYAQVTFIDRDHIDWDQNGVTIRYRRVGTTSPSPTVPLTPSVTPRTSGPPDRDLGRPDRPDPIRPRSPFPGGPSGVRPDPSRPGGRGR